MNIESNILWLWIRINWFCLDCYRFSFMNISVDPTPIFSFKWLRNWSCYSILWSFSIEQMLLYDWYNILHLRLTHSTQFCYSRSIKAVRLIRSHISRLDIDLKYCVFDNNCFSYFLTSSICASKYYEVNIF